MKILLVEDDASLAMQLTRALHEAAFAVDFAGNGVDALHLGLTGAYDCVVLDLGLPDMDGASVLQQWRAADVDYPVLILTSRYAWADKSEAFASGADDYMVKPFLAQELIVRLKALIRRGHGTRPGIIRCGELEYDTVRWTFKLAGEPLKLTAFEMRILSKLIQFRGSPVGRDVLFESVYESDTDIPYNSMEVLIGRLRRKIGPDKIQTLRGLGYCLVGDDA